MFQERVIAAIDAEIAQLLKGEEAINLWFNFSAPG